ncbi:hypothetical protein M9H77_18109 [Catharanthus roseus]|uniref:Uncharacterized protein n=1 Tax=Catharanthus roseus TaxID=4058 RepID=A0ACC0B6I4_CATRO|nr:hypothetical protein M9H77_18109 [Catharanthus roseus]
MRRVETVVSSVYATFDEHMRWLAEQSHLSYTLIPLMMDIIRATMVVGPSTSLSKTTVAGTSNARVIRIAVGIDSDRKARRLLTNLRGKNPSVTSSGVLFSDGKPSVLIITDVKEADGQDAIRFLSESMILGLISLMQDAVKHRASFLRTFRLPDGQVIEHKGLASQTLAEEYVAWIPVEGEA